MKLIIFLTIGFSLQVSANALGQRISLSVKEASFKSVLQSIQRQSGYSFLIRNDQMQQARPVTLNIQSKEITEVLPVLFSSQPFSYEVDGQLIKVVPKSLSNSKSAEEQQITIKGRVTDSLNNPLIGVTVQVKESGWQTITDREGRYEIEGVYPTETLHFRLLSYEPYETPANRPEINVTLRLLRTEIEEVEINAGYYTVKDRERTGSISRITAKEIEIQPVNNLLQAMQGRIPGVEIEQLTGVPGGGFKVQIRGRNSMLFGNDPLYIIDGVIFPSERINLANSTILGNASPLSMINPNDIESIVVLKDADATAIYGSRGANGVILISTKQGISDKTQINIDFSQGVARVGNKMDLLNTQDYLAMRLESFQNYELSPTAADLDLTVWDENNDIDWQEEIIGGTSNITNASAGITGGTSYTRYMLTGTHYVEGTVFPGNFRLSRSGIHTNISFGNRLDRFQANFTANYSDQKNDLPFDDPTFNIFRAPNAPAPLDQEGNLVWYYNDADIGTNPMASLLNTTSASTNTLLVNTNIDFELFEHFHLSSSIGYNKNSREELSKMPNIARNPATNPNNIHRQSQFGNTSRNSYIFEPQIRYNVAVGQGEINSLIGLSFQQSVLTYKNIQASNFNSDELLENISSGGLLSIIEDSYTKYRYTAGFARINYSLRNKYFLNLTGRRDGSSRFGPGRQFANFGALGGAWLFSAERFIKDYLPLISFGKLRGSYGITGNDQIPDYQYMDLYVGNSSYSGIPSLYINRIANPDFAWETNEKIEGAVEIGIAENRFNFQIAYYRNKSSNQLLGNPLPPSVGADNIIANLPAVVQNTGWEFDGSLTFIQKGNWHWSTNFNLSVPRNKLLAYPDLATSTNRTIYIIGQPLDIRRLYNTSVDPATGMFVVEDYDGNGIIDFNDRYLTRTVGQQLHSGIQNSIRYKNFNVDFHISYVKQRGNSVASSIILPPGSFLNALPIGNLPASFLDVWKQQGDEKDWPKFSPTLSGINSWNQSVRDGTQSIEDCSFLRLKNISIGYNLPSKLSQTLHLDNLTCYAQGQNLFTITSYKGLDPESTNSTAYKLPPLQVFTLGIKTTF
ncbi:SusC/RagA family TonB-linked outer membrane protein [Parapedobacter sp. 2B3]